MTQEGNAGSLEYLVPYAQRLAGSPGNANAISNFLVRLAGVSDVAALHHFAQLYTPQPEVSIPVYRRMIDLDSENGQWHAELGFVYFLIGEDELAEECRAEAQRLSPDLVLGLELEASLERDAGKKKLIYERIVNLEPTNRVAFEHLVMLQAAR